MDIFWISLPLVSHFEGIHMKALIFTPAVFFPYFNGIERDSQNCDFKTKKILRTNVSYYGYKIKVTLSSHICEVDVRN